MLIVNRAQVPVDEDTSPRGTFKNAFLPLSQALGHDPKSDDARARHPFDVEIMRVEAGRVPYPYHSHSAQWEFYLVLEGKGFVRHADGTSPIVAGDIFVFKPGEAHQVYAAEDADLEILIVADNPVGESTHYPDSDKWIVRSPVHRVIRSQSLDYYDGEE